MLYEELRNSNLNKEIEHYEDQDKKKYKGEFSKINISNISFSYPGTGRKVIQNIFLTIKKGESIGIIGSSGSGKSTLVDLIIGKANYLAK